MILRVLLLISFTCCVSGTFEVNVTQSFYQAEENHNITLEWSFTTTADTSNVPIEIYCEMRADQRANPQFNLCRGEKVPQSQDKQFAGRVQCDKDVLSEMPTDRRAKPVFHLHRGEEVPQSQDKQFAGRVQCDKDVLREGRLRLDVSKLRIEDSGLYWCEVVTSSGADEDKCLLSVTAARVPPVPVSQGGNILDWLLGVLAKTILLLLGVVAAIIMLLLKVVAAIIMLLLKVLAALVLLGLLFFCCLSLIKRNSRSRSNDGSEERTSSADVRRSENVNPTRLPAAERRSANTRSVQTTRSRNQIYQVTVNGIRGETVTIDLCNSEEQMRRMTVLQLKEKIAQKLPETAGLENMRLIFRDKALEKDTDLLSGYGIQHMSVLHIVLQLPGGLTA